MFRDWISGKKKRLWGMAPPGAGKTFLVSRIQAELRDRPMFRGGASTSKIAVMYMHYNDQRPANMLLGCMLRQFIGSSHSIPSEIDKLENTNGDAQLDSQQLVRLIQGLADENNLYLVIDAWDECQPEAGGRFLKELLSLGDQISVFITSRFTSDTERSLSKFYPVKISANADDIRDYVSYNIAHNSRLKEFAQTDKSLEDDIKHKLIQESGTNESGIIFLLVRLHMESLQDEVLLEDVRSKLKTLKHDLNDKYRDIIHRVGNQNPSRRTIAVNALIWITYASRPLMAKELQHALAVSPEDQQYKPGRMPRVDDIIAFCCGMVVLERSSDTFRLVHNTARAFMGDLTKSDKRFKDPHCCISLVIANYLCMPALEQPDDPDQGISYAIDLRDHPHRNDKQNAYEIQRQGYCRPVDESYPDGISYQTKMRTFPLARYAGIYLGHHLRAIQNPGSTLAMDALKSTYELLSQRPKKLFYERLLHDTNSYPPLRPEDRQRRRTFIWEESTNYDDGMSVLDSSDEEGPITATGPAREITPLHLAAQIGIPELVARFLNDTSLLQVRDYAGLNPLGVALCSSHADVVLSLLKAGSNLDLRSSEGCQLLLFAAQSDSRAEEVVHLILEHSLLIPDKGGNVVLKHLAWLWILAITKLRYYGSRILQLCQARGSFWKACRLGLKQEPLPSNADPPDTKSKKVHLSSSAEEIRDTSPILSQVRIARTYSEAIFPPERQEQRDYLKFVAAALRNDCEKIESLVKDGKVLLKPRGRGHQGSLRLLVNLALFLALENNNTEVVKLLINGGVSVESRDFNYRTPLHRAVARSNVDLVEYLMSYEAEVDPKDCRQETPWTMAVRNHDEKMCGLLVKSGANVHTRGLDGKTLLYEAAAAGKVEIVKLLLKQGVDPSVTTDYGWSSLHWAAANGKLECVRLLLDAGANRNPLSDTQKSPLDMAIERNQTVIEGILRREGAETSDKIYARYGGHHYSFFDQDECGEESNSEDDEESESEEDDWE
ncbi:hypothetical protein BHE90_017296 [Fusarium euwallaceae]|uniref:Uncharacterized protein n=2 Tax=Fusarium solani species complex TaxID=232080 RepID=A0A3M2R1C3_9HYPO|nr:hypothetical protein CDV36_016074 [Fusarium kuroshium]RTE68326.1 hypothetical protein BHE90_017296 [Fusarium euwallaceae]